MSDMIEFRAGMHISEAIDIVVREAKSRGHAEGIFNGIAITADAYDTVADVASRYDCKLLCERLRADDLLYNRGPQYEPLRVPASDLRLRAADSLASKDTALAEIRAENKRLQKLVNAFKDDGLVQAAIARQTFLQEERDDAIAELAEFDEANRMLVKSADGWRDKFRAAEVERDAWLDASIRQQKRARAAESELALVKKALADIELELTLADGVSRGYDLKPALAKIRSISQDGEERS